jgi:hypothetical protein
MTELHASGALEVAEQLGEGLGMRRFVGVVEIKREKVRLNDRHTGWGKGPWRNSGEGVSEGMDGSLWKYLVLKSMRRLD